MYQYYLKKRADLCYDLIISIDRHDAEFGLEFLTNRFERGSYQQFVSYLTAQNKKIRIKSIHIVVSGLLVAVIPFCTSTIAAAKTPNLSSIAGSVLFAAQEALRSGIKFNMSYLYGGTVSQQIAMVDTTGCLDTVSPSYFDLDSQGNLSLNGVSQTLIDEMHKRDIKVVPMLSNHWNRNIGEKALDNPERLASQIIAAIEKYNLDGVNVDIENVTQTHRDAYTRLVRLLREGLPKEKEVSVAVAANPNSWTQGWHGSYDYAALGKYADYLMIMTYDESWQGGPEGPVASLSFVEKSIDYALKYVSADKVVVGLPFYGRIWSEDGNFNGNGVNLNTLEKMLSELDAEITFSQEAQSPKAEFTITSDDKVYTLGGKQLKPGKYTVWFENEESIEKKIQLVHKYDLKGIGSWALNQATDGILGNLSDWLQTEDDYEELEEPLKGIVTASSLRIRSGPSASTETIGYLPNGAEVSIIGRQTGWYRIELAENTYGYVSADYIEIIDSEQEPEITRTAYSTGNNVRVRSEPSTSSAILSNLNRGDSFTVMGEIENGWYRVTLSDGASGYVYGDYVSFQKPVTTRTAYSTGDRVRVRTHPNTSSAVLSHFNRGDSFTVVGEIQNGWYKVALSNGASGYVYGDYVAFK